MRTAPSLLHCYVVEWYRPDMTDDALQATLAMLDASVSTRSAHGSPIHILVALAVPTDEVIYGVIAADSSARVKRACQNAGIPVGRVTAGMLATTGYDERAT
jgi:hypothetical protein